MNKRKWYPILAVGLIFLLGSSIVGCGPPSPAAESPPSEQPPADEQEQPAKKPAEFKLSSLTFTPSTIMVGDSAAVSATVRNVGDVTGTYTAILAIGGEEIARKDFSIGPGSNGQIGFEIPTTTAGEYELAIGELNTVVTVHRRRPCTIQHVEGEASNPNWLRYISGGWGHSGHFTPPTGAFEIQRIGVKCNLWVKNSAELNERQFTVRIWDRTKTQQLWSQDFPWQLLKGKPGHSFVYWHEIDVTDVRVDDDFYVEIVTYSEEAEEKFTAPATYSFIGLCYIETGVAGHSGFSYKQTDTLLYIEPVDLEWFIRVEGECPSSR